MFCGRGRGFSLCRLNHDIGLEGWYNLWWDSEGVLLTLPVDSFRWSFSTHIKEKAFARSTAAHQVLGNVLICSSNETTSGLAVQQGSSHNRIYKNPVMLQDPSVFCTCQIGELKRDVMCITTFATFKFLIVVLIFAIPPKMWYCFGLHFYR